MLIVPKRRRLIRPYRATRGSIRVGQRQSRQEVNVGHSLYYGFCGKKGASRVSRFKIG